MDVILIAFVWFCIGVIFGLLIKWWHSKKTVYTGTIVVTEKTEGVTSYSLEIEDLTDLTFKDEAIFKIKRDENSEK